VLELGYFFNKKFWHKGYATEAAQACVKYCFEHLRINELSSIVAEHNLPSMNVAIRLGMLARERYLRDEVWQYRFSINRT
jgi:RimJ/RimL family protein N-acetyltransferase